MVLKGISSASLLDKVGSRMTFDRNTILHVSRGTTLPNVNVLKISIEPHHLETLLALCRETSVFPQADQIEDIAIVVLELLSHHVICNLHACDHRSLSSCACFSIRRTVLLRIPTIRSAIPFEDGWCAGENDRMTFLSQLRSLSFWLRNSPPPSAWIRSALEPVIWCRLRSWQRHRSSLMAARAQTTSFFGIVRKIGSNFDSLSISIVTAATRQYLLPSVEASNVARSICMTLGCRSPFLRLWHSRLYVQLCFLPLPHKQGSLHHWSDDLTDVIVESRSAILMPSAISMTWSSFLS